jgi:polysaccharide export outer membrane protein
MTLGEETMKNKSIKYTACLLTLVALVTGCSSARMSRETAPEVEGRSHSSEYLIGPGDVLQVFVWRNPEISVTVPVRPEGKISTPLVEDMMAAGKTPTRLARDIERVLSRYIKSPVVTVIVTDFVGTFGEQIRVVGQAANPQSLAYRSNMTLLDVMIEVGGLTEYAAGNRAKIIRKVGERETKIAARLEDLLQQGDIGANVKMMPGDILIIPEAWF